MGTFKNIKDGWSNYLSFFSNKNTSEEIKKLAQKRADICKECDHLTESKTYSIIEKLLPSGEKTNTLSPKNNKTDKQIKGYKCNQCGCGFPAMVFAPNKKCAINKW